MGRYLCLLTLVPLLGLGCGRLGFNNEVAVDAAPPDTSATPLLLACGSPTRFDIDVTNEQGLAAVPTTDGFGVFAADGNMKLWGWSYEILDTGLAAVAESISLGTNANGTLGGAAQGDHVVFAAADGSPATGTTLFGLTPALTTTATPNTRSGEFAGVVPLAAGATNLAYVTQSAAGDANVRLVDATGADVSITTTVDAAADGPYFLAALATPSGFAVGYATGTAQRAAIATFDPNLGTIAGPVTIDAGTEMYSPWFAYAPAFDRYLIAWHQKDVTDDDDVWAAVVTSDLQIAVPAFEIAPYSQNAVIASDASGFWVGYDTYDPANMAPDHMAASHVDIAGNVVTRTVENSGGSPADWTMIARAGQAVLVWNEANGTGPNLYFDPMCPGQ